MKTFKMKLPGGWYPLSKKECKDEIESMISNYQPDMKNKIGGIVPHAGWDFSGRIAAKVIKTLAVNNPVPDYICVIGGHLAGYHPVLFLDYDEAETPLGNLKIDRDFIHKIIAPVHEKVDDPNEGDNTIEILLPLVKYFFPDVPLIGFRPPLSNQASYLGERIAEISREENKNIIVIGSADLTHYGPNYGFMPAGTGEKAMKWVSDINDKELIHLILQGKIEESLFHCKDRKSSCSGGAIASVMAYAKKIGFYQPVLLQYATSYEVYQSNSFVGYCGIVF